MHDDTRETWTRCPFDCDICDNIAAIESRLEDDAINDHNSIEVA